MTSAPGAVVAPVMTRRGLRVVRNVASNYLRLLLTGAVSILLTPFLVHRLGDRDYGLWVTVFSLTGYFGLLDQGIRPSLVRYVSRDHAAGDREGLSRTISSAIVLYAGVGVVTMLVAMVVAANVDSWWRIDPSLHQVAPTLVMIVGATLALGFPLGVFGAVLSGLQRYDLANGIGMAVAVIRPLAFVATIRMGGGLMALGWVSLVVNLFGHAWAYFVARGQLPGLALGRRYLSGPTLRRIGAYSGWALLGAVATNIAFQTDSLVITTALGAALVTPFSLAAGLVDNARSLVHAAAWVLSPTASEMETLGERDQLHGMLLSGARYSVLLSWPVLFGLIVFGGNLFATWVGARYAGASLLLTILCVPTLLSLPQAVASSVLYGISRHRGVVLISLGSALVNLGLSLWWANDPSLMRALFGSALPPGLVGVAMGTAVPLFLLNGVATAAYSCRVLGMPLGRYLRHGLLDPGTACLVFLVPATLIQWRWHPTGWGPLLASCAGSWLVFAVVAWHWAVPPDDRVRWLQMARLVRPNAQPETQP